MSTPQPPQVRSRRPTGKVPWPMILVEGGEKSGKSWAFAQLTGSARIGQSYWIDLGEGTADEYGQVPGSRFEILEHDGTYAQILERVREAKAMARWAADNGQLPVALAIDTISDIWDGLKNWASDRARQRRKVGPDVEVNVSMDLWNDSGTRYRRLMTELLTFPGIVVLLARGKEVAAMDDSGRPIEKQRDHRVEGHKTLAYDATVWVRMSRTGPPVIVGARSVHAGIRPGKDEPKPVLAKEAEGRLLEWLVFDALRCDPRTAEVRDIKPTTGGDLTPEERGEDPRAAELRDESMSNEATFESVGALFQRAKAEGLDGLLVADPDGRMLPLGELLKVRGGSLRPRPAGVPDVPANANTPARAA